MEVILAFAAFVVSLTTLYFTFLSSPPRVVFRVRDYSVNTMPLPIEQWMPFRHGSWNIRCSLEADVPITLERIEFKVFRSPSAEKEDGSWIEENVTVSSHRPRKMTFEAINPMLRGDGGNDMTLEGGHQAVLVEGLICEAKRLIWFRGRRWRYTAFLTYVEKDRELVSGEISLSWEDGPELEKKRP